jgi:hypothetical protein
MSMDSVEVRLARLLRVGVPFDGVPLCMLPDPCGRYSAWSQAHEETERTWAAWKAHRGRAAYCAYRAAADREDRAQELLALRS